MKVNIGPYPKSEENFDRKIEVHIDGYDTWNADHTLSLIILPVLKQLRKNKCSAPFVDYKDVPKSLRPPKEQRNNPSSEKDDSWFDRWNYVLDEMIFSFECIANEDEWEGQFFDKREFDKKGYEKYSKRIHNGLKLFGKYYRGLWT